MKRLIYLIPSLELTANIIHELKKSEIDETQTHVVGRESHKISQYDLNEANIIHKSDVVPAIRRGASIGLLLSFVACGLYAYFLPDDFKFSFEVAAGIIILTTLVCAWGASLAGVSVDDPVLKKYKKPLKAGHYLLMIDSNADEEEAKIKQVLDRFEQAELAGIEG